ncbi:substrate-binding domain-containing protein [Actinomadura sp. WMMB 499]|uniref:substrate-binding domain-containing protein n=1 Tax=Actinomadura sp. WMMB 499 TaxID=1219491 RepID=UPI0034A0CBC3
MRRCAERGVAVPGDLSVVGYDDIFGADFCSPPLTTLAGQFEESGRTAVDMLLAMRDRHGARPARDRVVLPSHLAIRRSTGPLPPPG